MAAKTLNVVVVASVPVLLAQVLMFASACVKPIALPKVVFEKVDKDTVRVHEFTQLEIVKAEEKSFPRQVDLPGRIVIADQSIIVISSRVSGRVENDPRYRR